MSRPAGTAEPQSPGKAKSRVSALRVILICTGLAFLLGPLYLLIGSLIGDVDLPGWLAWQLLIMPPLILAAIPASVFVRNMRRQTLEDEFFLSLGSALFGALIFVPVLCAFVVGLFAPYLIGIEEQSREEAAASDIQWWPGIMLVFLFFAAILGVIVGVPVGLVAWASRFFDPQLNRVWQIAAAFPWPWRIGLGVPLLLGLALALGAVVTWAMGGYVRSDELEAGGVDEFAVGEPRLFEEEDIWIVRLTEGSAVKQSEFVALYDRGLESGCPLQWRKDFEFMGHRGWFVDACNGAAYDLEGLCASDPCRGIRLDRFFVSVYGENVVIELDQVTRDPSAGETLGPTIPADTPPFPTPTR